MKFKYQTMLLAALFIASCSKNLDVGGSPDFEVNIESNTYKIGEEITFNFQGHADLISFYSGEDLNDYAYREGHEINVAGEEVTLEFNSSLKGGAQEDELSVWVSTDFNGNDDLASVKAATWTEITDRFVLGTSATLVPSTAQSVADLIIASKPFYIAFKYVTRPQVTNGLSNSWIIESFALNSALEIAGKLVSLADQGSAGFKFIAEDPENTPIRSSMSSTRLTLLGNIYKDPADPIYDPNNPIYDPNNPIYDPDSELYDSSAVLPEFVAYEPGSPYNDPQREHWAITKAIPVDKVDIGPDWSKAIKGISNSKMTEFTFAYDRPGTYKAYFIASNTNIDNSKQVVRELTLTITD